ncbi:MAG: SDR family oxidoreductase [Gammaproteobacteria bacterium]|nr:SDR family oxidoreductase [Gammaproteobacteria bacterium]
MKNRTILITGCSSGIGLCLADGLRERGYRVFATARKSRDVEKLNAAGHESLMLDLDSSESINDAVTEILKRTNNSLYGLINNGAYGQPGAVEDLSRDVLRAQFETNLLGTQELTNKILPVMRQQGAGRIIQISSVLGIICLAYRGAYNATKYALEALSDTMRLELRGTNIYISLVEPGPIASRFRDNALAAFHANINVANSAHKTRYEALLQRLEGKSGKMPFTLPPEAVLEKVIHALEADRPRVRYAVTFPTYLFAVLRRILPARWLDTVLYKVGDSTNK